MPSTRDESLRVGPGVADDGGGLLRLGDPLPVLQVQ